jgi:hypothetical protein
VSNAVSVFSIWLHVVEDHDSWGSSIVQHFYEAIASTYAANMQHYLAVVLIPK